MECFAHEISAEVSGGKRSRGADRNFHLLERLKDRDVVVATKECAVDALREYRMEERFGEEIPALVHSDIRRTCQTFATARYEEPLGAAMVVGCWRETSFALQPHPCFHQGALDVLMVRRWISLHEVWSVEAVLTINDAWIARRTHGG